MHRPTIACVHFHSERERGFSGPLQHCFLGAATAGLLVAQRHRLNSTHQVGKGGIFDQVGQLIAVGRGHQNHTPLSDGTGCLGLQLGTNLIDHDDFWHVVFHRLDHHLVLQLRPCHLHPAGPANGRMGDVAISGDLIACVYNYHPLI
jgi:hypothetical protein